MFVAGYSHRSGAGQSVQKNRHVTAVGTCNSNLVCSMFTRAVWTTRTLCSCRIKRQLGDGVETIALLHRVHKRAPISTTTDTLQRSPYGLFVGQRAGPRVVSKKIIHDILRVTDDRQPSSINSWCHGHHCSWCNGCGGEGGLVSGHIGCEEDLTQHTRPRSPLFQTPHRQHEHIFRSGVHRLQICTLIFLQHKTHPRDRFLVHTYGS